MTKQTASKPATPPKQSDFEKMIASGRLGYSSAGATRKK
jgi:hypothetical protein